MKLHFLVCVSLILLTVALTPAAHADIYKCKDEHGNVAYLQTPCPPEKAEEPPAGDDDDAHKTASSVPVNKMLRFGTGRQRI